MVFHAVTSSILAMGAVILFKLRGVFAMLLAERNMRVGDYNGALRTLHWVTLGFPTVTSLHREGLILSLGGRPAEAIPRYRQAIAKAQRGRYQIERLHACLGYALLDMGVYDEAEQCFHRAIEAGDHTGNSQDGLAEVRLYQGIEPEQALSYARQAIQHAQRRGGGRVNGSYYAHEAWALALLGRRDEAQTSLQKALQAPTGSHRDTASVRWRVGMVLLAMGEHDAARMNFQIGADVDPRGKYGARCRERL
jgi:tetratricopeptide (TPR) repeat protein